MRIYFAVILILAFFDSRSQSNNNVEKISNYKYCGYKLGKSKNKSFINKALIFIRDKDTIILNQKLPFQSKNRAYLDKGIFKNCKLKKGVSYSIFLRAISSEIIPISYASYYHTNAIFDKSDSSLFREVSRNTPYKYLGNYDVYVDMNSRLYEIISLDPPSDCFFDH